MSDKKHVSLILRFKCPKCGGFRFGTSGCTGGNPQGHCHDFLPDRSRCNYTWDRNSQDKDIFTREQKL